MSETAVPELRFPEFEGEWITKPWKTIAPLQRGFDLPVSDFIEGSFPVVYSNGILRRHIEPKVSSPGVVTGRSGTIGKVTLVEEDYWPHNTSLWVTDFCGNDPRWISELLRQQRLEYISTGSGVPTLNRNEIHRLKVSIPTLPEQKKIAAFLSAVDEKLAAMETQLMGWRDYKRGIMQALFSQALRFKADDGSDFPDWKDVKFSEVLLEHKLKSAGTEPVYSVSVHKGLVDQIEHLGRSYSASDTGHYNRVKYGDIIYTKSPTGNFPLGIIKQSKIDKDVIVSPLYGVFTPSTIALGTILDAYFEAPEPVWNYLNPIVQKGAKNTISCTNANFLSNTLELPVDEAEQQKIADALSAIDEKIEALNDRLEAIREFKRGLLQKMFV